ncbi:PARD3 family protein [Megaselia abdita]
MKVTVCFGPMRILVPCQNGDLTVKELINEAKRRYKKAAGKEPDSWVSIHHLQTQSGILDPDDCVKDVVDDRELILASFEDSGPDPGVQQGGGDGASGTSSVGTGSPDIFRDPTQTDASNPHIEVTSTTTCPINGLGLQVRRSSDPNLIQSLKNPTEPNKRWSAAAPACSDDSDRLLDKVEYLSPQWEEEDDGGHASHQPATFSRSGRLSMQFLGDGNGYKWMEAAEKYQTQAYSSKSLPREAGKRKEPLGQAYESIREKDGEMLLIINEFGGPLGLTALPDKDYGGVLVTNVEQGSRAERGRLRRGDRILEINGTKLSGLSDVEIQESLKRSLDSSELRVRVIRGDKITNKFHSMKADQISSKIATVSPTKKPQGAPVSGTLLQMSNTRKLGRRIEIALVKGQKGLGFSVTSRDNPAGGDCPKYIKSILPIGAAIEDGRLKPGDRLLEVDGELITDKTQTEVVETLKSKKLGSRVVLVVSRQQELVEEEHENEIAVVNERDVQAPQSNVRSIIEAKFENAAEKSHEIQMNASKSQSNVKNIIEQLNEPKAESQHFIDAGSESTSSNESQPNNMLNREILSFNIPVHDSERAGLGIKIKGKKGVSGIFISDIIYGGAASKDGRLKPHDLILSVNEVSLLTQPNNQAEKTLRSAVYRTADHPKYITLMVARNLSRANSSVDVSTENSQESSNTSENSGATVIYLTPEKKERNELNRWNNPVLERLTGGVCSTSNSNQPMPFSSQQNNCWRNESYYMATDDTWSPARGSKPVGSTRNNNSVLIEDDSEPMSPTIPFRPNDSVSTIASQNVHDATYSSQLSLDTNTSAEHFSRDAIGRRSISEKQHAALDARETGTYQRNKKLREERDRERRLQLTKSAYISGSMESITTRIANANKKFDKNHPDLQSEARDMVGDLGPSLGLKKSSSLESLQTMVQEIQMDESRGPKPMLAPRGRIREESLRAAVVSEPDGKPRKTWLLEETDNEGGFISRSGPFQSSLNNGKNKQRTKKPSILRGIGNMFRIGKHRKDGITPSDFSSADYATVGPKQATKSSISHPSSKLSPPSYQPPPQPPKHNGLQNGDQYRQQQYANYEELQSQIRKKDLYFHLGLDSPRGLPVPLPDRRQPVYHSQRSSRNQDINLVNNPYSTYSNLSTSPNGRPISGYYEYETVQHNVAGTANLARKLCSIPDGPTKTQLHPPQQHPPQSWKPLNGFQSGNLGGSGRSRGPYVTQVHIPHSPPSSTSSNGGLYNHHNPQSHASKV